MKIFFLTLIATLLAGCASATKLTSAGEKVRLMKDDPPKECKELGNVEGFDTWNGDTNNSKNIIRNNAADIGANYVRFETAEKFGKVTGTAFKCP